MQRTLVSAAIVAATLATAAQVAGAAESLSVLHWWTSGGESKAIRVLKDDMNKQGYEWKDFAIAGGAGAAAMTALKTQVMSGNAPSAAQIKGPLIQDWADQGVLVDIDKSATGWKAQLPAQINKTMMSDGHYVAAPFSVHRINWLWINKADLDKVGGKPPETWPEFFALADKFRAAGITPVARGGQPWQDMTIWEAVVLSQGADFYRKAMIDLDQKALTSPQMLQVFQIVRRIQGYFDKGSTGRDWNLATAMVINGTGGMQFMGDWAKGEFANANKKADVDYVCTATPGTSNAFTYTVDSFVFFQQNGKKEASPGQLALAKTIMSVDFQEQF
ncbi:ABC transporter substrate-binding protein, partial [Caballeronia terrestris]|uniref:ABC transporter substrate-binding protein n=1 Tax=Caballeronia terrestris TaxID=1226301 RepID=UPI000AFA8B95